MPRAARIVVPGVAHHVTQRGNNRQDVFFTDDDRRFYLKPLREQAERFVLAVTGYCLMTNHVHLIVTPGEQQSLARAVGTMHLIYSQYVNRLHGRSGHLWQNRFYSCPLDGEHEVAAVRYAERNPVRAGMVQLPWKRNNAL
jgi:putative transposase